MYMLNDLKSKIVEIEKQNDWEYNFISDMRSLSDLRLSACVAQRLYTS